jgi:hypothetical protein
MIPAAFAIFPFRSISALIIADQECLPANNHNSYGRIVETLQGERFRGVTDD